MRYSGFMQLGQSFGHIVNRKNNIKLAMVTAEIWLCSSTTNCQVNQTFLEEKLKASDERIPTTVIDIR